MSGFEEENMNISERVVFNNPISTALSDESNYSFHLNSFKEIERFDLVAPYLLGDGVHLVEPSRLESPATRTATPTSREMI